MITKCLAVLALTCASAVAFGDEVVLTTGEVLKVSHVDIEDGRVEMDHPILGHLDVSFDQVSAVRGPNGMITMPGAIAEGAVPLPPAAGAAAPPEEPRWKFRVEAGINGESGNTRSQDLRAAVGALLETPSERWKFDGVFNKSKANGEETKHNWYVQGLHDWLFKDSPWMVFVSGRYEKDSFQQWTTRIQGSAGVGYRLIDDETTKLRLRAGINEVREYDGPNDGKWRAEGLLGAEGSYKINEEQSIEASVTWYPDLQESGEYRLVSTAAWSIKLSKNGLSLKIGLEDEVDTHREAPQKRNDFKYFGALLYEF